MKRKLYYLSFILLGAMLGFLLHALVEIIFIKLLLADLTKYGFGLTWEQWELIHDVVVPVLILCFAFWGFHMGKKCWQYLYIEQRYLKRWGVKLKKDF